MSWFSETGHAVVTISHIDWRQLIMAYTFLCALHWGTSIFALLGDEFDTEECSFAHASGEFGWCTQWNLLQSCCLPVQVANGVKHIPWHLLTAATGWMDFGLHLCTWRVFLWVRSAGENQPGRWQRYDVSPFSLPSQFFGSIGQLSWIFQSNKLYEIRVQL